MRPGVGEKGESVSGGAQLYHPLGSFRACNFSVSVEDGRKKKIPHSLFQEDVLAVPRCRVGDQFPPSLPTLGLQRTYSLESDFRTREALSLEYCISHPAPWNFILECSGCVCTTVWVSTSNRGSNYWFPVLFFPVTGTSIYPFIK